MDPKMTTRPPTPFKFYMTECRHAYLNAHPNPNDRSESDFRKQVRKGWSQMSEADKAIYFAREEQMAELLYSIKLAAHYKEAAMHVWRPPCALSLFTIESREAYEKTHPHDRPGADFFRDNAQRWSQMSEADKATYYAQEMKLLKEYNRKLAAYNDPGEKKKKEEVAAMDPKMTTRPPTPFKFYMTECRQAYLNAHPNPNDGSESDFRKQVRKGWSQMSEADKAIYFAREEQMAEMLYSIKLAAHYKEAAMHVWRPPCALSLFTIESREAYEKAHPHDRPGADFFRDNAQRWSQMSEADKATYYSQEMKLLKEYNRKLAAYNDPGENQ